MERRLASRRVMRLAGAWAVAGLTAASPAALAGDGASLDQASPASAATPEAGGWEVSLAPYLWVSDVVADYAFRDFSGHAEPHLKDLLSNLDLGLMGAFEVYHVPSRVFLHLDAFWMRLSSDEESGPFQVGAGPITFQSPGLQRQVGPVVVDTPRGPLTLGPFDVDTGPVRASVPRVEFPVGPFDVEQTLTQSAVLASVGYRVLDEPLAGLLHRNEKDDPRRLRLDLYGGGRLWYVKADIEVAYPPIEVPGFAIQPTLVAHPRLQLSDVTIPGVSFGGRDVSESESTWWVDPVVGIRLGADLSRRLGVVLNGNVGGFGVGSASEWSWEGIVFLTWRLGERWTAAAGYRGLGADRRNGDLQIDLLLHGPLLGLIYRF